MRYGFALAAGCAVLVAGLAGCSSQDSGGSTQGRVMLDGNDAGPVTGIGCATESGRTTITIEGDRRTTVVLSDADAPVVETVSIGEVGSDGPSLAYVQGVSGSPAQATRDGASYTVSGTGMGTDSASAGAPVDMPFEIEATCP